MKPAFCSRTRELAAWTTCRSYYFAGQYLVIAMAALSAVSIHAQQFPFGIQHQPYRSGTMMPTNYSRAQMNADVGAYYDVWKSRWLKPDPEGHGWRVISKPTGVTVSEGQGYGMVIVPLMAGHDPQAQAIFDGLWKFRLAHPSVGDSRLMDWSVPLATGNNSAFDGDADIAYGLLLAHAQWGSEGTINYLEQAQNVIAGIRAKTIGPTSKLPMLGDWVNPTSTGTHNQWATRSSDFMPGHFRAFGMATNDAAYWNGVVQSVQNVVTNIQTNESASSGLLPDFVELKGAAHDPQPASPGFLEGPNDGNYWYNAGRDPWRLGTDAALNNDPVTLAQVRKISQWARTEADGDPNDILGGYRLNGSALNEWSDLFFISPLAVAAMTGTTAADQAWLNSLYARIRQSHNTDDYYADAVTLQSMLVVSGNMWDPMAVLARVSGDYNRDGKNDVADYRAWRGVFGSTAAPMVDGNGNGVIDAGDYVAWRNHFGWRGSESAAEFLAVPEPMSWQSVLLVGLTTATWRARTATVRTAHP